MSKRQNNEKSHQIYYNEFEYKETLEKLPELVKEAERKAAEVIEPTLKEKHAVMKIIRDFIREKERIVYGGTALNELLIRVNEEDHIYDEYEFSDIEFYSFTPTMDAVELCNILYDKGYKFVQAKEAQHEETYSINVNLETYCDITYVPKWIFGKIQLQSIEINGIYYVNPHFMLIDFLRMFTDPLNSAWRWEKAFKRTYLLLKDYPLDLIMGKFTMEEGLNDFFSKIKNEFLPNNEVREYSFISGFDAYNFFFRYAQKEIKKVSKADNLYDDLSNLYSPLPLMELVSIDYEQTVIKLFNYLIGIVPEGSQLYTEEYYPFFQFQGYSTIIYYQNKPLARIIQANKSCVPVIKIQKGYMYVSYQYLLMSLLINRFRAFVNVDKMMNYNYSLAISNLVRIRNVFLRKMNLPVINDTIFSDFSIDCVGYSISPKRLSVLRKMERRDQEKSSFFYTPEYFHKLTTEEQMKFKPESWNFHNSSGNIIKNSKNFHFKIEKGFLSNNISYEEEMQESQSGKGSLTKDISQEDNHSP
jgi:hypothetical protein